MRLVVAHFNEELKWLESAKPYVDWISVMTCCRPESLEACIRGVTRDKFKIMRVQNAGQESFAYADFIRTETDGSGEECYVFCQANPFDHANDHEVNDSPNIITWLREFAANPKPFKMIGRMRTCPTDERLHFRYRFRPRSPLVPYVLDPVPDTDQMNPRHPMLDLWRFLLPEEEPPKEWKYSWGNQFAVHRDLILRRPLDFWKRLAEVLEHDPKPLEATCCERMFGSFLGAFK